MWSYHCHFSISFLSCSVSFSKQCTYVYIWTMVEIMSRNPHEAIISFPLFSLGHEIIAPLCPMSLRHLDVFAQSRMLFQWHNLTHILTFDTRLKAFPDLNPYISRYQIGHLWKSNFIRFEADKLHSSCWYFETHDMSSAVFAPICPLSLNYD